MAERKRLLVVGGVAGGASVAARARRLSEDFEIIIFERGEHVSFANCGLPYYVGDVIQDEDQLLVATPERFEQRFAIEVRVENEVTAIDREGKEIEVHDLGSGRRYRERYDVLVLAPGAQPIRPAIPGIDLPGIFALRTIPDSRLLRDWISARDAQSALVVGGGFIGLEMAENLVERGLEVTVVELADQVMPAIDSEMAILVEDQLQAHQVWVNLEDAVTEFVAGEGGKLIAHTKSDDEIDADLVVLAIGVRPNSELAVAAGLEVSERGGIVVDAQMRTADPHIWAVGDAVEVTDVVTGRRCQIPLAGPANRQGRIAADAIAGRDVGFRGVQGTAICGVFDLAVAVTGASEKSLRAAGIEDYAAIYLHPHHHAGYYPGAREIHLKLLFRLSDGRILGAQAIGEEGVARRIDVIAMALQKQGTVFDLEEAELCYAPQFGAAKDAVNVAGMIAANVVRGDHPLVRWQELDASDALIVDVRHEDELSNGRIPGSVHIPMDELRQRLGELPKDRPIWFLCREGQRGYFASRVARHNGLDGKNLSGGWLTYRTFAERGEL